MNILRTAKHNIGRLTVQVPPESVGLGDALPFILAGGIAGGASYIAIALALENSLMVGVPTMTYGQEAGWISLPICALIGGGTGASLFFARYRQFGFAAGILVGAAAIGYRFTHSSWQSQYRQYGPDSSDVVLYYPPIFFCIMCVLLAVVFLVIAVVHRVGSDLTREPGNEFDVTNR